MTEVGPHLLGRRPSPPDARDYPLAAFLGSTDPLDAALAILLTSHAAKATKAWAVVATQYIHYLGPAPPPPSPAPTPTPTPAPSAGVTWADVEVVLDQGQTPHCVGFAGAQWGNTLPVDDKFVNADGDKFYYACKVIDGEPGAEDGSDSRSLAKVLQAAGRLKTYAFAASVDEAVQWILTKGPMLFGTDWTNDMFYPDKNGLITPTGAVEGGHEYVGVGYDPATGLIEFLNSWSDQWGANGRFFMAKSDYEKLWSNQGEALAAVELP